MPASISRKVDRRNNDLRQRRDATGMTSPTAECSRSNGENASSTIHANRASGRRWCASVSAGMWWITSPSEEVLMNRMSDTVRELYRPNRHTAMANAAQTHARESTLASERDFRSMRLYTALAVTLATAVVTLNFWQVSSEPDRRVFVDDIQPLVVEADDDLTLMLRGQARTELLALQQRQGGAWVLP